MRLNISSKHLSRPEAWAAEMRALNAKRIALRPAHSRRINIVGRGLIGRSVDEVLQIRKHETLPITRQHADAWPVAPGQQQWWEVLSGEMEPCDVLIQATGASIFDGPLTPSQMREHYHSRVGVTKLLVKCLKQMDVKPKTFILTSSIQIYPADTDETFDESYKGPHGRTFLSEIFSEMEEVARTEMAGLCERIVIVRPGHVIASTGLLGVHRPDRYGRYFLGRIGSGGQCYPWIHAHDLAELYSHIVSNESISGVINAVSPNQIQQRDIAAQFKRFKYPRPYVLPVPKMIANYLFTDRAFYLLESRKWPNIEQTIAALEQSLREPNVSLRSDSGRDQFARENKDNAILTWGEGKYGKTRKIL